MASSMLLKDLDTNFYGSREHTFDIAKDYPWTLTDPAYRTDVPYIQLVEFEQTLATLYSQIYYWTNGILKNRDDPFAVAEAYEGLYNASKTGIVFKLPYFEEYDHLIQQTWEKGKNLFQVLNIEQLQALVGNIAKILGETAGTFVNQPRVWSGPESASYVVNFFLFNTFNMGGSYSDIIKNLEFKQRLQMSTLHSQQNALLSSPPAIFEVTIPGVRHSPAAVISQLSIVNVGQMNLITIGGKAVVVPDAWGFTLTISELIPESRQILHGAIAGPKVVAMTEIAKEKVDEAKDNFLNLLEKIKKGVLGSNNTATAGTGSIQPSQPIGTAAGLKYEGK